ncbi:hypothetical protein [Pseudobacillus wudalianchiensis]|uniref:DUF3139 domain-containing protein n=1 Tax=Pseudobacillus wudalianchiensis TaxID=1743143 RepID=A0A1B9ANF4_9BACI|nr:hypothetical protein [Bacillus wudalianchiensis]OCA85178.1 hypothetical protein A8F95_10900 [Bacillus wudalianchiensis]
MNKKFTFFLFPALFILLAAASSFDFSSRRLLEEKTSLTTIEPDSEPVLAESTDQNKFIQSKNFKVEEELVQREEVDDYMVETYREYEVYTDSQGNEQERIPTSNYSYIRYHK